MKCTQSRQNSARESGQQAAHEQMTSIAWRYYTPRVRTRPPSPPAAPATSAATIDLAEQCSVSAKCHQSTESSRIVSPRTHPATSPSRNAATAAT